MATEPSLRSVRRCWCGNAALVPFGADYGECRSCGTLVLQRELPADAASVTDDEQDFYGKQYWLQHQNKDFGYPDIFTRVRSDLAERNLHWLKALLKFRLPPAEVLELGCAHGSFVALMRQAGFHAAGTEMSPWVVDFARKTFAIPVYAGPVESLDLPAASLDCIALMDVLEHLPEPAATMRRCLELLKPDGLLLIQTPCFIEGRSHEALVATNSPFLEQLKTDEHLFLFSQRSVADFFRRLGAEHIRFEAAIFSQYDMFFVASRTPLVENAAKDIDSALTATPNGRIALALLDLEAQLLGRIGKQGKRIEELEHLVWLTEQNRDAWKQQAEQLQQAMTELQARWWYRIAKRLKAR